MNKDDNTINAIVGEKLYGTARIIRQKEMLLLEDFNFCGHKLEENAQCIIIEPKKQKNLPYEYNILKIKWNKNDILHGGRLHCEGEECKKHGGIHRRHLKGGKKHGQTVTFDGEYAISIVLMPVIRNKPIELNKYYSIKKIKESKK